MSNIQARTSIFGTLVLLLGVFGAVKSMATVKMAGIIVEGKAPFTLTLDLASKAGGFTIIGTYQFSDSLRPISVIGRLYGTKVIELQDFPRNGSNGGLYLELLDRVNLKGFWKSGEHVRLVAVQIQSGSLSEFQEHDIDALKRVANPSIAGTYVREEWFLNAFHVGEVKVGCCGGVVVVYELSPAEIAFEFQFICDPTYDYPKRELAMLEGRARLISPGIYEIDKPLYEEEKCRIQFKFANKAVELIQCASDDACGFSAHARASGVFTKVNNLQIRGTDGVITTEMAFPKGH